MSHAPRRLRRTALTLSTAMVAAVAPFSTPSALAATATARSIDDGCPEERVPDAGLNDVEGTVFEREINCLAWYEITAGNSQGDYAAGTPVTRGAMAVFLTRLITATGELLDPSPPSRFDDAVGTAFETQINQLAQLGIVSGSQDTGDFDNDGDTEEEIYRPNATVTRAQMASFINATHGHITNVPISTADDFFGDDDGTFHEDNINAVASVGVATGVSTTRFNPNGDVTRGAMAAFLSREIDYLVELDFLSPPVTGVADVILDSLQVNQGRQVIGRIVTEDDVPVAEATVDICEGENGVDVPMNEDNFTFSFTMPFDAEVGLCELDFDITLGNNDRELESQVVEVLETEKVLAGPELVSIAVQTVGAETVTIRYEFNAQTELNDAVEPSRFRLYGFAGQQFQAFSAAKVTAGSVEAQFTREQYDDATTGGIAQFAVQDQNGFQVAEYSFGIKDVALNAGETSAPDLVGVTSNANTVTYTFDAPVYGVDASDFGAVYSSNGATASVNADAITNGGEGSTSFTATFTVPESGGVILRGYVNGDSIASAPEGELNNGRQSEDVPGPSQATSPHLTSVILDQANDKVLFVFSEAVQSNAVEPIEESPENGDMCLPFDPTGELPTCQTLPGRGFQIYDINGDTFESFDVTRGSNNTLIAQFGQGEVTGLIQGGSADANVARAARNANLLNGVDEIGRQNTFEAGTTASPDLLNVTRLSDADGNMRLTYTYDQTAVISNGANSSPTGQFVLYAQDNTRRVVDPASDDVACANNGVEIVCTLTAGTDIFTFASTARYASSSYAAVNAGGNEKFSPEGGVVLS